MSKRLYAYGGFTSQQLKDRSSIPSQGDITVGDGYIDCASVDIPSEIRDVIGEGSNDLGTIYCSAKVNKWSGFGPWEWYVDGTELKSRLRSNPYDMSNFCGYNHNAPAPRLFNCTENIPAAIGETSTVIVTADFQLGELKLPTGFQLDSIAVDSYISQNNLRYKSVYPVNLGMLQFTELNNSFAVQTMEDIEVITQIYLCYSNGVKSLDIPNINPFSTMIQVSGGMVSVYGIGTLSAQIASENPNWEVLVKAWNVNTSNNTFIITYGGIQNNDPTNLFFIPYAGLELWANVNGTSGCFWC